MGKKTLYHPMSLHVIRGAAEYCGWKFGRISQIYGNPENKTARYDAEIVEMPSVLRKAVPMLVQSRLQACFMDDVRVHWVHETKSGKLMCQIQIDLKPRTETAEMLAANAADLPF